MSCRMYLKTIASGNVYFTCFITRWIKQYLCVLDLYQIICLLSLICLNLYLCCFYYETRLMIEFNIVLYILYIFYSSMFTFRGHFFLYLRMQYATEAGSEEKKCVKSCGNEIFKQTIHNCVCK